MPIPAAADRTRRYTYGEYLGWTDEGRCELIDGVVHDMTPAPLRVHQQVVGELHRQLANHLFGKTCRVFVAPFDVRLPEGDEPDEDVRNVVQPDLSVVCDPGKLDERGCRGAPDLTIEVLSRGTATKDVREKFRLYERMGVREYWVVFPNDRIVTVFLLGQDGRYGRPQAYGAEDRATVSVLPGCTLELQPVFQD